MMEIGIQVGPGGAAALHGTATPASVVASWTGLASMHSLTSLPLDAAKAAASVQASLAAVAASTMELLELRVAPAPGPSAQECAPTAEWLMRHVAQLIRWPQLGLPGASVASSYGRYCEWAHLMTLTQSLLARGSVLIEPCPMPPT